MSSQPSMIYKAVKNYISNELGISKEDIVGVMNNVIERHVHRQLSNGNTDSLIRREVRHVISNMMSRGVAESSWYANNTSFEDYVKRQVREEVSKIVQESISVQITSTPPTQQEDRQ